MGTEIHAGEAALYTRKEAFLVTNWCSQFDNRDAAIVEEWERMGVIQYPAEVVQAAHAAIPLDYKKAISAGFDAGEPESFASARRFLELAAAEPDGISGQD